MSYANATFFLDFEAGSDSARANLVPTAYANNGSGLVRVTCNSTAAYSTGAVMDIAGTTSAVYDGAWIVTIVDGTHVDLQGSTFSVNPAAKGTLTPRGGSSKTDAWKTITSGVTSARHAAGDTIRMMASLDPTSLGINATWNQNSKTVTLASALTTNISDCETAWTASVNVTATANSADFKENTKSASIAIASAFTTGLAAFFATGTLDLSSKKQVSFWVKANAAVAVSTLSLRLCSDAVGLITVNTIAIPALPFANQWSCITVDTGGALGASIASVALYADLDPGTVTVLLDNIIACKDSTSADSLTLRSLIGKVWDLSWAASTTYATNDIRKPTQSNRNGFRFKVTAGGGGASGSSEPTWPTEIGVTVTDGALTWTCDDLEDTWYPIQSINGTTIKIDNETNCLASAGRGYEGTTETLLTYKRECIKFSAMAAASNTVLQTIQSSGTELAMINYTGGWNRTDMTTQTGETWIDGQNGGGYALGSGAKTFWTLSNFNGVRTNRLINLSGSSQTLYATNCHALGLTNNGFSMNVLGQTYITNCISSNCGAAISGYALQTGISDMKACSFNNNQSDGILGSTIGKFKVSWINSKNNNGFGFNYSTLIALLESSIDGLNTNNNASGGINATNGNLRLNNCLIAEGTEFAAITAFSAGYIYSQRHDQTANNHLITTDGGTIISATDQLPGGTALSRKFRPTSVNRHIAYPLEMRVARIACAANLPVTVSIWTRRDNANIVGTLLVRRGQVPGVAQQSVACAPSINTDTQSGIITFTATENGVVEVVFQVYDGVGTTNNFWAGKIVVTGAATSQTPDFTFDAQPFFFPAGAGLMVHPGMAGGMRA